MHNATWMTVRSLQTGAGNFETGQVSVDNTSGGVEIVPARPARRSITIINHGTTNVFIGADAATTDGGALLPGIIGASITMNVNRSIKGITSSGSQTLSFIEEYE